MDSIQSGRIFLNIFSVDEKKKSCHFIQQDISPRSSEKGAVDAERHNFFAKDTNHTAFP